MSAEPQIVWSMNHNCKSGLQKKVIKLFGNCFTKHVDSAMKAHGSNPEFNAFCHLVREKTCAATNALEKFFEKSPMQKVTLEKAAKLLEDKETYTFEPFGTWSKEVLCVMYAENDAQAALDMLWQLLNPLANIKTTTTNKSTAPLSHLSTSQSSPQLPNMTPLASAESSNTSTDAVVAITAQIKQRMEELALERKGRSPPEQIDVAMEFKKHAQGGGDINTCDCHFCVRGRADHANAEVQKKLYHPLCDALMQTCVKRGFTISRHFASTALNQQNGKLVPAFKAVQKQLEEREAAIGAAGRVCFLAERAGILEDASLKLIGAGSDMTRDMIVKLIEVDDQRFKEFEELGWDSVLGRSLQQHNPDEKEKGFRNYTSEAKWRNSRAQFYTTGRALVQGGAMTEASFKEDLERFDDARVYSDQDSNADGDYGSDGDQKNSDVASCGSAAVARSYTAVMAEIEDQEATSTLEEYHHHHTEEEKGENNHSNDDGQGKYVLSAAEKQEIRLQFEATMRTLARDSASKSRYQPGRARRPQVTRPTQANQAAQAAQAKETVAEASSILTETEKKRKTKGKGKKKVTETPTPLPPINPNPLPLTNPSPALEDDDCKDCPACRAQANLASARATAARTFNLPENVPFQDDLGKMTGDMTEGQIRSLETFMRKLSVEPEQNQRSEKREAGGYNKLTEAQRHQLVLDRNDQPLVKALLMCTQEERQRHEFLIDKHWVMTGGQISDRKPAGGRDKVAESLLLGCPSIKSKKQALEELAIAGGNPELAFAFATFRETYLDRQYGKGREPYGEEEALRFAAAVRYNIDLVSLWVGPDFKSARDLAKEAAATASAKAHADLDEAAKAIASQASSHANKGKPAKGKGKGKGKKN